MIELKNLTHLPMRIFKEHIADRQHTYVPFARTESFLLDISRHPDYLLLHFWPMETTVILGMLDRKLPYLAQGRAVIRQYGYEPFVRHIGGLAVVADAGVLNFSLLMPDKLDEKIGITDAYRIMVNLIKTVFADYQRVIDCFKVENSYCPGEYDLSIDGKKFAGIAQRRLKKGIVVSIYLSVRGNQALRGQIVADFYRHAFQDKQNDGKYPDIDPTCMANLSDLLGVPLSVEDVIGRIKSTLSNMGFVLDDSDKYDNDAFKNFYQKMETMQERIRDDNE